MNNVLNVLQKFYNRFFEHKALLRVLFYLSIFLTGAIVIAIELLGARIISVYYGSTVYVWSSLITVAMAGLALGYYGGGAIAKEKIAPTVFLFVFYIAGVFLLSTIFFSKTVLFWTNMFGIVWGPFVASTILFFVPIMCFGAIAPLAVKQDTRTLGTVGSVAGKLYALSTIGSLFGALFVGFFLAPIVATSVLFYWTAFLCLLIAFLWIVIDVFYGDTSNRTMWYAGMIVVGAILASEASFTLPSVPTGEQIGFNESINMPIYPTLFTTEGVVEARVLYRQPSPYGDVVVFDSSTSNIRCFLIDGVNETCWNFDNGKASNYVENTAKIIRFLQEERDVEDVLVVGVGGATLFKVLDGSGLRVDGVEINENMLTVSEDFFVLPKDLEMNIDIDDGRHYLINTQKKYDVIVMDICFVNEANVHLWTKEFYALVKDRLNEGGVVIATRGMVSGDDKMEKLDHMTYNALGESFAHLYSGNRFEDRPGEFYMGLFIATDKEFSNLEILGEHYPISPWTKDLSYPIASDDKQAELLDLVYPATEAILEQSRINFGEALLLPL